MGIIYRPKGRAEEYAYLAVNLYDGCGHKCKYCYVATMPQWRDTDFFTAEPKMREDVLARLLKDARKSTGTNERVLLCFSCDPYQPLDDELNITGDAMHILRKNDIPFQVLTKGGMRAVKDFGFYGPYDAFATTLTFLDPVKSKEFEPFAALPADRIRAIQLAHERGIKTWVSLEPVVDAKESLEIIRQTHKFVDHYKIGVMNHHKNSTNWRQFGRKAIELCRGYKIDYYIKKDLAIRLDGVPFCNVDTRTAKRVKKARVGQMSMF